MRPYLNRTVQDELHELVLHVGEAGVEADRHLTQVGRDVGAEVLDQPSISAQQRRLSLGTHLLED